jgi:serine/threonine protein kinase
MATRSDNHLSGQRISPGTRLNGIYEVGTLIATGGMGEIYKGHVIQTGDPVAIKLMLPDLAENEAALALFRKEASALHHLQHDAIVRYYVFTVEPVLERPYLAMEFVDGRLLSDVLEKDGALPFEAVRALMQRIASGLQAAHERGIVHRDVSPDNIILPLGDVARAKIIDFGIARSTQLSDGTVIGSGFAGKYNYVSPEQLGLFGGIVTAKSDIYSLGLVLVQALTGRAIDMGGSQFQIVEKRRALPDLGAIDMRFRPLLEKMLQPNPADRLGSMAMCANALLGTINDDLRTISSRPTLEPPPKKSRHGMYALVAGALIAVAVGTSYYMLTMDVRIVTPRPLSDLVPVPVPSAPDSVTAPAQGAPPNALHPANVSPSASTGPSDSPASRTDGIKRYVKRYNGGDCFFVTPVAIGDTNASLEGFGVSTRAFELLDDAFKKQIGFAADIGVRQVTPQQCPAINFLAHLPDRPSRPPRIDIDKMRLASQDTLNGSVDQYGNRAVQLFLVGARGNINPIPLRDGIDAKTFALRIRPTGDASEPVLLMAVAGDGLQGLRFDRPAEEFFSDVLNQARRTNEPLSVAVRYLRLEP